MDAQVGGSFKNVVHRWQKGQVIQLQCSRLQSKAYFDFNIGYFFKGVDLCIHSIVSHFQ